MESSAVTSTDHSAHKAFFWARIWHAVYLVLLFLILSLMFSTGLCWWRSSTTRDIVEIPLASPHVLYIISSDGIFHLNWNSWDYEPFLHQYAKFRVQSFPQTQLVFWPPELTPEQRRHYRFYWKGLGYNWFMSSGPGLTSIRHVCAPYWMILSVFLIALVVLILVSQKARQVWRRRLGLCGACGYDLRASKDACPECGAPINAGE